MKRDYSKRIAAAGKASKQAELLSQKVGGMKDRFSGLEPPGTWCIYVFVSREPPSGVQKVSTEHRNRLIRQGLSHLR